MKDMYVAVAYADDGTCKSISKVKTISKADFNKLTNECEQNTAKKLEKDKSTNSLLKKHSEEINALIQSTVKHNFLLAKSIYDKFVDRGYIEEDAEFQQMFYEYVMLDKELDHDKYPEDFKKILIKVGEIQ